MEQGVDRMTIESPSFGRWLVEQRTRNDPIGDLAKDAARDDGWPVDESKFESYCRYLARRGVDFEPLEILVQAFEEYAKRNGFVRSARNEIRLVLDRAEAENWNLTAI
jgi:uncharacterized protein YozE (UPF0346 family)